MSLGATALAESADANASGVALAEPLLTTTQDSDPEACADDQDAATEAPAETAPEGSTLQSTVATLCIGAIARSSSSSVVAQCASSARVHAPAPGDVLSIDFVARRCVRQVSWAAGSSRCLTPSTSSGSREAWRRSASWASSRSPRSTCLRNAGRWRRAAATAGSCTTCSAPGAHTSRTGSSRSTHGAGASLT